MSQRWLVIDNPEELKVLKQHTLDWVGDLLKNREPLRRGLNIPDGQILTAALMPGHPKYTYFGLHQRNKPLITLR